MLPSWQLADATLLATGANFGSGLEGAAEGGSAGQRSLLSLPLAANIGPGPEGAAERLPTKWGVCFSSSLGVAHCVGQETMAKGHMDNEFASLRLSPPSSGRWRPGWKNCCSGWLWRVLLAISRMLSGYSVAVLGVMLLTVPDFHRET